MGECSTAVLVCKADRLCTFSEWRCRYFKQCVPILLHILSIYYYIILYIIILECVNANQVLRWCIKRTGSVRSPNGVVAIASSVFQYGRDVTASRTVTISPMNKDAVSEEPPSEIIEFIFE